MNQKDITDDILWYKDAIIYELHVKAFYDSNGDGIGDMEGLLQKLDYLEDLGVTAIWMLPFYPSPLRDDGYDIADYYSINPSYGDIKTFKKVVKEAHKRGMKVITELVINHTSDQHPWFQRARKSPKGSKYRDYYVWSDDPTLYKDARIIFTDYEPSNWSWDPVANAYYWHRFFHHQPDLNFDNPDVQQEIFNILDYWVNLGVDGFRLDAVPYLFERDGTNCENLPETHVFLKKLRSHIDEKYGGNILFLAEANMWPEDSVSYFGEGDECHMNYHFPIMPRLFMSVKMEDRYPIIDIIDQTPEIPENCQWAIFLRNHDELTLEMVTDEERDFMYKVYTKDAQAKINLGIRQRLAPLLDNNRQKIELLNTLLFSLPGTPVIYYGDEIGMGDNFYLGDRDGVRTPMQWSPDRNAGFSVCNPHQLYLPVIIDPEYKFDSINVETQRANSSSLFWWMKRMIAMRKKFQAFSRGTIEFLSPSNAKVLAFIRSFEDEHILVIANLSRFSQAVELDLEDFEGAIPVEVFGQNKFPKVKEDGYMMTLSPYAYYWFALQEEEKTVEQKLPSIDLKKFTDLNKGTVKSTFESKILPKYLRRVSWFRGVNKKIQDVALKHVMEDEKNVFVTLEVSYDEGLPENYLLGMTFCPGEELPRDGDDESIIAKATLNGQTGHLIDSVYDEATRNSWFQKLVKGKTIENAKAKISFQSTAKLSDDTELFSYLIAEKSNNAVINYSDQYVLKLFRQIDQTIHPDLEITRFLSETVEFENVPAYKGLISLNENKSIHHLGMVHAYVPAHSSAKSFVNDNLKEFYERLLVKLEQDDFKLKPNVKAKPKQYKDLPEDWQEMIGYNFVDRVQLLGKRTAELHKALASDAENPAFKPENFSLHYQRSLFSPLQGLTRGAFDALKRNLKHLPEDMADRANELLSHRKEVLEMLKQIYVHKFDAKKIRNHGDLQLKQVLWDGKDFTFIDFEGELFRPFSERRLKRSPLRDVAAMIRSMHYAAYNALLAYDFSHFDDERLPDWAENWHRYASDFYLSRYLKNMEDSDLIPKNEDLEIMLNTYLLERLLIELKVYAEEHSDWITVSLNGIFQLLDKK